MLKGEIDQRVIRVFISSTFRDMQSERDYLVKFIFPQLRKLCEERGVTWGEVDLRWGVTNEQAAEGKVLPICLEEIKRCRPYFIGLLGERYGWVPDSIPAGLLEAEPWLKEQFEGRKSVTELEILHGVLRSPDMAGHAYFYFRDPAFVDSMAADKKQNFIDENPVDAQKLSNLKESIRKSGFPVHENFPTPQVLGALILKDLTDVIDRLYPEGSQPDPLDREAMDHEAYAHSRARIYIGRDEYFKRLNEYADGQEKLPLVILGESGSGKSALLANWAAGYSQDHSETLVLQHYIGATPFSTDWTALVRRIMGEFKRNLGLKQDLPDQPDALRSAFPNWLSMASAQVGNRAGSTQYKKIVMVLDALNQLEDWDGAPDLLWLPPIMPENVRLIVSTLPGRALEEIIRREWTPFHVEPLSLDERRELIRVFLLDYGRALSPVLVERIASSPQAANPLYLRVLLDELRVFGVHEKLEERIDYYLKAASPYELYEKVMIRWENDYEDDSDLVGDALSLLWAARRGLSETELLGALGQSGQPLSRAAWSPLFLAMSDSLVSRGGLLTFSHDFLRTAARDVYIPEESHQQKAHVRLADYFEMQPTGPRRMDEFPWQLAQGKAWQKLKDLLTEQDFFMPAWNANQFDVKTYWARLEDNAFRKVEAYKAIIDDPEGNDDNYAWSISIFLADSGYPVEALKIRKSLTARFYGSGDTNNYQASLGNQGIIHYTRGELDEAMRVYKEQARICRELGNQDGLSAALGNQALILKKWGKLDEVIALYREQERICRELGNKNSLQASLGNQGIIHYTRGEFDEALRLYREQERICRELGKKDGLSASLGNQAVILKERGERDEAMKLHKEEERICRELGYKAGLSVALGNQALILKDRGELDEAMKLHKEEERICKELGSKDSLQRSLGNQAVILRVQGQLDKAMTLHKEQERICRELGNKDCLSVSLGDQAVILRVQGQLDKAMTLHKEQERICRELGKKDGLSAALGNLGIIHETRGELNEAMSLYKEQERIYIELGKKDGLSAALGNQGIIRYTRGELNEAMRLYKEQERICMELGDKDGLSVALGNQALILKDRGELDEAMKLLKEQERICRELGTKDHLQVALGNQAIIHYTRGELKEAMRLYKEQELICRKLGHPSGLATSLVNQSSMLAQHGQLKEALILSEEAYNLANKVGLIALTQQIKPLLDYLRSK